MEEAEREAYLYGGKNGGEYLEEINKYNIYELSSDEWLTFLECICKNYHLKLLESQSQS